MAPDPVPLNVNLDFRVPGEEQNMLEKSDPPDSLVASKQQFTKILIVDDLISMRDHMLGLLRKTLPGQLDLAVAVDCAEAKSIALLQKPDAVIVDTQIGESSGFRIAEKIWKDSPHTKILFWSRAYKEKHIWELERIRPKCTSYGYILKSETDAKLTYAIESIVLHDNPYLYPLYRISQNGLRGQIDELTEAELETLQDVAIGLTDRAIAQRRHISVRGVQNRISILLSKVLKGECGIVNDRTGMESLNQRSRLVYLALCRGLIDQEDIEQRNREYFGWLEGECSPPLRMTE